MDTTTHARTTNTRRIGRVAGTTALMAAAVAAPMLSAAPASAAEDHTWTQLSECESGKRWKIDTGNGYYGGLQFSDSTWDSYGGEHWAPTADRATRAEQVFVAEKVLDGQGWDAWPACSEELGLDSEDAQGEPSGDPNQDADGRD